MPTWPTAFNVIVVYNIFIAVYSKYFNLLQAPC